MKKKFKIFSFLFLLISLLLFSACDLGTIKNSGDIYQALNESYIEYSEGDDKNNITNNVTFVNFKDFRFRYSWESDNPDIISDIGIVNQPTEDTWVSIKLTVSNTEISVYKTFELLVKEKRETSNEYSFDIEGTKSKLSIYELNDVIEDKEYTNHLDVIAYIHKFHKLPKNYLTKSQAKSLGWRGSGNVWANDSLYGKCIGGDTFNNREQRLPLTDSNTYIEVDVNCTGGNRGAYRIVYNRYTFDIYYTSDHYATFTYMIGEIK